MEGAMKPIRVGSSMKRFRVKVAIYGGLFAEFSRVSQRSVGRELLMLGKEFPHAERIEIERVV